MGRIFFNSLAFYDVSSKSVRNISFGSLVRLRRFIGYFVIGGTTKRVVILHAKISKKCGIKLFTGGFPLEKVRFGNSFNSTNLRSTVGNFVQL